VEPSDWVSVAALGVAAVSIVVSGYVAPRIGARIEREHRISAARSEVYAETIQLLRARVYEIDGYPPDEAWRPPTELEAERTIARLLLYTDRSVWTGVKDFTRLRQSASSPPTERESADLRNAMGSLIDAIVDQMRGHVGTKAFLVTWPKRTRGPQSDAAPPPDPRVGGRQAEADS
jgi:hypothetical protein